MTQKQYYTYLLTNRRNTVIYTGITSDLIQRIYQHKHKLVGAFTKKFNVDKLVYYEIYNDPFSAIEREKQIKAGSRADKVALIESINPAWRDLFWEIADDSTGLPRRMRSSQ